MRVSYEDFPRAHAYRTILADPPYPYRQKLEGARGELPYESLSEEAILSLPVAQAAADDCLLLLWTTNAHLPLALKCVSVWGFEYKTLHTWGKVTKDRRPHFGLGYWLRGATEQLIVAVRGSPRSQFTGPHGGTGQAWCTLGLAERRAHSQKPDYVYAMAEDMGPPPRLELFARAKRAGWATWGNVVPRRLAGNLGAYANVEPRHPPTSDPIALPGALLARRVGSSRRPARGMRLWGPPAIPRETPKQGGVARGVAGVGVAFGVARRAPVKPVGLRRSPKIPGEARR